MVSDTFRYYVLFYSLWGPYDKLSPEPQTLSPKPEALNLKPISD